MTCNQNMEQTGSRYIYLTGYQAYEAYAQLIFTLFHSLKGGWREALDALGCGFSSSAGNNGHGQRPETNNDDIDMAHLSFLMQHMGDCNRCVFTCLNHDSRSDSLGWDFNFSPHFAVKSHGPCTRTFTQVTLPAYPSKHRILVEASQDWNRFEHLSTSSHLTLSAKIGLTKNNTYG